MKELQSVGRKRKSNHNNSLKRMTQPQDFGCTNGCTIDSDLASVIEAWPRLPESMREAILKLIG
jgi:hypothetical protein